MGEQPLWTPSEARIEASNLKAFMRAVERRWGVKAATYDELWRWSVAEIEKFWLSVLGVLRRQSGGARRTRAC